MEELAASRGLPGPVPNALKPGFHGLKRYGTLVSCSVRSPVSVQPGRVVADLAHAVGDAASPVIQARRFLFMMPETAWSGPPGARGA